MKKKIFAIIIAILMVISLGSITRESESCNTTTGQLDNSYDTNGVTQSMSSSTFSTSDFTVDYENYDNTAILKDTKVSASANYSISEWHTNNKHIVLNAFDESPNQQWSSSYNGTNLAVGYEYRTNITDNGTVIPSGCDDDLKLFDEQSNTPNWSLASLPKVLKVDCTNDEEYFFVVVERSTNLIDVRCYDVDNSTLVWSEEYSTQAFKVKGLQYNEEKDYVLVSMVDGIAVLEAADGDEVFFSSTSYTNSEAELSEDGNFLVFAESNQNRLRVFEYDDVNDTYTLDWQYTIPYISPSQTHSWGFSASISGDGSTIVVGTLQVFNDNSRGGGIICFASSSSTPLWSYTSIGHVVYDLDISWDGTLIAVGSWGPISGNGPDFYMFNKLSSTPIYTVSTDGSVFKVSISDDASYCSFGGKAVHANVWGNGGFLYGIVTDYETKTYSFSGPYTLPHCGWTWLSFDILHSVNPSTNNQVQNLLYDIKDNLDHGDQEGTLFSYNGTIWSNPTYEVTSPKGYKIEMDADDDFDIYGERCEPETTFDIDADEDWIGYFLEDSQHIYDAFNGYLDDNIKSITHQDWSVKYNNGWPDVGYTLSAGDMVILDCEEGIDDFSWPDPERTEPFIVLQSHLYEYTEEADYIPIYIDLNENDLPDEIGVFLDDECVGARVVQHDFENVCTYITEAQSGEIEIEFAYYERGSRQRFNEYTVYDEESGYRETTTINLEYDKQEHYYISFNSEPGNNNTPQSNELTISNSPNPFNPSTSIYYNLPIDDHVQLSIYNLKGQKVKVLADGTQSSGNYNLIWDGTDSTGKSVSSGVYLYQITTSSQTIKKKILMLK
ncbi:MAG: T9SS type A sorting domain-containing protein [Candidatus Cloacimonetes bacterium]|nr:T9SS type A sorting domain-containing protein [Candidatus Cloacimonadota bacterium]MCF7814182.1 T9SS type A sorting domain-containing protein [Candidatus Cloacimonadota bacterium]MCF7868869.1 T9SS type A sorting domain-containing protein [Candidatus Cloacimonadota bacterium]MCF7884238.1 T9SS type A sorting domain-containing protein [Candidatus Cloacimonadota bacterium]